MRRGIFLTLVLLASCHKPSFDERYKQAQSKLGAKEQGIDAELSAAASDAAAAGEFSASDAAAAVTEAR